MKKLITLLVINLLVLTSFAQKWEYETIVDNGTTMDFAQVMAQGYEESINSPMLGVLYSHDTDLAEFFLLNVESPKCDKRTAFFQFNGSSKTYYCNPYVIDGMPFWYVDHALISDGNFFNTIDLFKNNSTVKVTTISTCGKKEFTFSLNGSKEAIEFVAE